MACHVLIGINRPGGVPASVWRVAGSHCEQLVSNKLIAAASQDSECLVVYTLHMYPSKTQYNGNKYGTIRYNGSKYCIIRYNGSKYVVKNTL